MTNLLKTNENLTFCEDTREVVHELETSFLTLGARLQRIRAEEMYVGKWETFEEYLMDAKLSPSTASKLINVYQKFISEWKFPQEKLVEAGGWSVLYPIIGIAKTKEEADDWISKASVLNRRDLEKEIKEAKTGIDMRHCTHEDHYIIKVCRTCGEKERIYEDSEEGGR